MEPYQELETKWAEFNGLDPAGMVACSSGTAALHLALEAFKLPQGSEVVTGDFNMIAVPRAITLAGLKPVFVDCNERLLIDHSLLTNDLLEDCRAAIIVHIYGRRDVSSLTRLVDKTSHIKVIEDLAEAQGMIPDLLTDAACWSFYRNKIVAGEEGGAVWFRDPKHAKLARQLRSLGFTADHDYNHVPRGHNYRMSNLHSEYILEGYGVRNRNGLPSYKVNAEIRRDIESWYDAACPPEWRMPARDAVWVYDIKLPTWDQDAMTKVVKELNQEGIAARHGFKPMSRQEEFRKYKVIRNDKREDYPISVGVADVMANRIMYLPVQPGKTTTEEVRQAFDTVRRVLG